MSDHSISIVPKLSIYPDKEKKAKEILDWLISLDIVKPTLSNCVLSSDTGYAISNGARNVTKEPDNLPFDLITNGLDIITVAKQLSSDTFSYLKVFGYSDNKGL